MSIHQFTIPEGSTIELDGNQKIITNSLSTGIGFSTTLISLVDRTLPVTHLLAGIKGDSAYQTALNIGYIGTEEQWINSLHGIGNNQYQHYQELPATTWIINHNLGFKPNVIVTTLGGKQILVEILQVTNNQAIIYTDSALAGYAHCS